MSKIIYANKLQFDVLNSKSRITVVTPQPGAGSTYALILKAIQSCYEKEINCTYFIPTPLHATAQGGIVDSFFKLLDTTVRYSGKSMIFSFQSGAKIKFMTCNNREVEQSLGLSGDLMLFDTNIDNKFIQRNLLRASQAVVVDSICNIERLGSWANELHLLNKVDGKIVGFIPEINHIKAETDGNYFMQDLEHYKELVEKVLVDKMRIDF